MRDVINAALIPFVAVILYSTMQDTYRDYRAYRNLAKYGIETSAHVDRIVRHSGRSPWRNYYALTYSFKTVEGAARVASSNVTIDSGKSVRLGENIRIVYVPSQPMTTAVSLTGAWERVRDQGLGCGILTAVLALASWFACSAYRKHRGAASKPAGTAQR